MAKFRKQIPLYFDREEHRRLEWAAARQRTTITQILKSFIDWRKIDDLCQSELDPEINSPANG